MKTLFILLGVFLSHVCYSQLATKCSIRLWTNPNPSRQWQKISDSSEVYFYSGTEINHHFEDSAGFIPVPVHSIYVSFIGIYGNRLYLPLRDNQASGINFLWEDLKNNTKLTAIGKYASIWEITIL